MDTRHFLPYLRRCSQKMLDARNTLWQRWIQFLSLRWRVHIICSKEVFNWPFSSHTVGLSGTGGKLDVPTGNTLWTRRNVLIIPLPLGQPAPIALLWDESMTGSFMFFWESVDRNFHKTSKLSHLEFESPEASAAKMTSTCLAGANSGLRGIFSPFSPIRRVKIQQSLCRERYWKNHNYHLALTAVNDH
jgi:hypothetical protein